MITFEYPAYTPTVTLTLPAPDKGDQDQFESNMIITLTRDNTQRSYVEKVNSKILELSFSDIKPDKRDETMEFFRGLGSNYIKYTDYIPRPVPNSHPTTFTFDAWILSLLENIDMVSTGPNKFEFTVTAERWPL